jgi:hypothetical protein
VNPDRRIKLKGFCGRKKIAKKRKNAKTRKKINADK